MRIKWLLIIALLLPQPVWAARVQEVVSPGGIKAWLSEQHDLPMISVRILFTGAGSAYNPNGKEGRAVMASELLMEGAGERDALAFQVALESHAISLDFTADDDVFSVSMETLSEHAGTAFSLLSDALASPRFDEAAVERVRGQALTHLTRLQEQPEYLLSRAWAAAVFGDHPYGRPYRGTVESLNGLTRADMEAFRSRYLTRGNMLVSVAGDITPKALGALLDSAFLRLPARYDPDVTISEIAPPAAGAPILVKKDIPQTIVLVGGQGIKRSDPRYMTAFVMNRIVGGGNLSSILAKEIREKRGLAYYVDSDLEPLAHAATWQSHFATRNEEAGAALATWKETVAAFVKNGASEKQLEDAKEYLTGSFVLSLDSNSELCSFMSAMQLHHLGIDYLERRNDMVRAVSVQEINALAKTLFAAPFITVMVGNPEVSHATERTP